MHTCTHTSMHTHKHKPVLWHNNQLCFRKMFSSVNQTKEEINCLGKRRKKKKKRRRSPWKHPQGMSNEFLQTPEINAITSKDRSMRFNFWISNFNITLSSQKRSISSTLYKIQCPPPYTPPKLQQLSKCPITYRIHSATPNFLELLITIVSQETLPVKSVTHALPLRHKQRKAF